MQRRACIATRVLSSSVVRPRQTLRELARDQLKLNPAHQLVVPRMRLLTRARHNAPRVCTSVLFIGVCKSVVLGEINHIFSNEAVRR